MKLTVNSELSCSEAIGIIRQTFRDEKYFELTIKTGKPRSLSLNAVLHLWCSKIAKEEREHTDEHIKNLVKYHIFMPIQRGEDPEYNDKCEMVLRHLSYEERIDAMSIWPVTRLMKNKPMLRGMEQMQAHYAGRVTLDFQKEDSGD